MRLFLALVASTVSVPALAQHAGHDQHPSSSGPVQTTEQDPHAGHEAAPEPQADPHAGHTMSAPAKQPPDPHAGHVMPDATLQPDPEHDGAAHRPTSPAPPVGPPPAGAFAGPENAADTVFDARSMQPARDDLRRTHGRFATHRFRVDRFEARFSGGDESYAWDADLVYGEPLDKLWLKSEGEGGFGEALERGEVQALWSHAIDPFFDLQAGLRYDFKPDPQRTHLVLGVQGTAPFWLEIDAAVFLSDEGEVTARIEGEYDLRITQRLVLQPRVELDVSLQDIPELRIGSGLTTTEAGLRLRYHVVPEFAPYVGVDWEQSFGTTREFRTTAGEDRSEVRILTGLRAFF